MESLKLEFEFDGTIWYWRGPAPFHFVSVPPEEARELKAVSGVVTYGWGVIPAHVRIRRTEWTTSLFPKDGGYAIPIKDRVRKAEQLAVGDTVSLWLRVP